jgi:hypothetical protein
VCGTSVVGVVGRERWEGVAQLGFLGIFHGMERLSHQLILTFKLKGTTVYSITASGFSNKHYKLRVRNIQNLRQ